VEIEVSTGVRNKSQRPLRYNCRAMPLTVEEVRHIARLARLALTEEEEARFAEQLSDVLDYADRLKAVDTSGIPPTASVLPLQTPLRPDHARPGLPQPLLLRNAPDQQAGLFRVPRVLDPEP